MSIEAIWMCETRAAFWFERNEPQGLSGDVTVTKMIPAKQEQEPVAQQQPTSPDVRDALLFCLWHHQGGSSKIGQPIRHALGIGQHDHLNEEQLAAAKRVQSALTPQPKRDLQFKEFIKWAGAQGYDCAQACNSDTGEWLCLNPMTADLWKAWQAAHGIKGEA